MTDERTTCELIKASADAIRDDQAPERMQALFDATTLALAGRVGRDGLAWKVKGQTGTGECKVYTVFLDGGRYRCNCEYANFHPGPCKHALAVMVVEAGTGLYLAGPASLYELALRLAWANHLPPRKQGFDLPGTKARWVRPDADPDVVGLKMGNFLPVWLAENRIVTPGQSARRLVLYPDARARYEAWVARVKGDDR